MDPSAAAGAGATMDRDSPAHTGEGITTLTSGGIQSRARTHSPDEVQEDAPLLNDEDSDYPSHRRKSGAAIAAEAIDGDGSTHWLGQDDWAGLPWWKKPSPYFLLPPFLIFTLAFGGTMALKFNLQQDLICRDYYNAHPMVGSLNGTSSSSMSQHMSQNMSMSMPPLFRRHGGMDMSGGMGDERCESDDVQRGLTAFTTATTLIAGFISAIVSPKLGALSDRYGRKPILVVSSAGMLLMEATQILAVIFPDTFPTYVLLLTYVVDGLVGSFTTAMALVYAYAADCTPPASRHLIFAQFHGFMFTGMAFGPLISAVVTKATGTSLVMFSAALGGHLIFISVIIFLCPESLSKRRQLLARQKVAEERAKNSPFKKKGLARIREFNILEPLKILYPKGEGTSAPLRTNLILVALIDTLVFGTMMGTMNILFQYQGKAFHWGQFEENIFMSIVNLARVACLFGILPLVTRIVRGKPLSSMHDHHGGGGRGADALDLGVIRVAILFDAAGFLGYTLVRDGRLFILCGVITSIGGMASPTLTSALTKHIPPEKTGQVLGAQGLLHAIVRILAPLIFSSIYYATIGKFIQTVWLALCITFAIAFGLSLFVRKGLYLKTGDELNDPADLTPGVSDGQPEASFGRNGGYLTVNQREQ